MPHGWGRSRRPRNSSRELIPLAMLAFFVLGLVALDLRSRDAPPISPTPIQGLPFKETRQ